MKSLVMVALLLPLAGCGLAGTGATAAAGAASVAQQARQARATEAKVQQQIDAAYREDAAKRKAAEAEAH